MKVESNRPKNYNGCEFITHQSANLDELFDVSAFLNCLNAYIQGIPLAPELCPPTKERLAEELNALSPNWQIPVQGIFERVMALTQASQHEASLKYVQQIDNAILERISCLPDENTTQPPINEGVQLDQEIRLRIIRRQAAFFDSFFMGGGHRRVRRIIHRDGRVWGKHE